jgi:hypothetical protein
MLLKSLVISYNIDFNLMHSEIQDIIPYFSKFENILPDEFMDFEIAEELGRARNEINKIIEEDLKK